MKRLINPILLTAIVAVGLSANTNAQETDSLGMIGDNLDLYAVLDAFKSAESVEDFEKTLNNSEAKLNNLDLDENNEVDYIQVIDNADNDAHALILRIAVSETESQDVAVIELEKNGNESATIQIVGDEELYGEDYIVEPLETVTAGHMPPALVVVNVWGWPSVRFIYGPVYRPWRSPWRWRHYPAWWRPWKPYRWRNYRGFHVHHHHHYRVVRVHRVGRAHKIYHHHRVTWKHVKHHSHHHHNHHKANKSANKSGAQVSQKQTSQHQNGGQKKVKKNQSAGAHTGNNGNKKKVNQTPNKNGQVSQKQLKNQTNGQKKSAANKSNQNKQKKAQNRSNGNKTQKRQQRSKRR